jgi:hypothetical protein
MKSLFGHGKKPPLHPPADHHFTGQPAGQPEEGVKGMEWDPVSAAEAQKDRPSFSSSASGASPSGASPLPPSEATLLSTAEPVLVPCPSW